MAETQFWSFAQGGPDRELYILDEISGQESWFSDAVTPKRFMRDLNSTSGDLTVWIDSPGGDAFAGAAIYEALRSYSTSGKGRVRVNIAGLAASAAGLIAMAGDEVRMSIAGTFMLHDPWSMIAGNSAQLRATADVLDEIREGQIRAYMRKSGKSHDEIMALIRGEGTYMNAKTAIENGFADGILGDAEGTGMGWLQSMAGVRVASCMQRQAEQLQEIASDADADARKEQARALMRACMNSY